MVYFKHYERGVMMLIALGSEENFMITVVNFVENYGNDLGF